MVIGESNHRCHVAPMMTPPQLQPGIIVNPAATMEMMEIDHKNNM